MKSGTVFLLLGLIGVASAAKGWGYGKTTHKAYGPKDWVKANPICGMKAQSPINLDYRDCSGEIELPPLEADHELDTGEDRDDCGTDGTLANNGHAPVMNIVKGTYTLSGGPLRGNYKMQQFHFHFGCTDREGSEHTFRKRKLPGELHLVFYNTRHRTFQEAADKPDGLAVIGILLLPTHSPLLSPWRRNRGLEVLETKFNAIKEEGSSVEVKNFKVTDLVPQLRSLKHYRYYTYKGSLTTPPCYESVRWIVLRSAIFVQKKQFQLLRSLKATHGYQHGKLCNNYRPVQPRNNRKVYCTKY